MGGLDTRFLIGHADGADLISSLTTFGTPFRGTMAADVAVDPSRLQKLGVVPTIAAISRYEIQGVALWPFAAPAQVHFATAQFRKAIEGVPAGDYSYLARRTTDWFRLIQQSCKTTDELLPSII
jgi:hypothetical protein